MHLCTHCFEGLTWLWPIEHKLVSTGAHWLLFMKWSSETQGLAGQVETATSTATSASCTESAHLTLQQQRNRCWKTLISYWTSKKADDGWCIYYLFSIKPSSMIKLNQAAYCRKNRSSMVFFDWSCPTIPTPLLAFPQLLPEVQDSMLILLPRLPSGQMASHDLKWSQEKRKP